MSQASSTTSYSSPSLEDDWISVTDPGERRKIQNRIAQRKFRDKVRQQKEEEDRARENRARAGDAYTPPEAEDFDRSSETGLPWGSMSLRHIVSTGKAKELSSKETSLYAAASRNGGSSRYDHR